MAGFDNGVMFSDNVDFSGSASPSAQVTTNGQLLIGSTAAPHIRVGTLASAGNTITITNSAGGINLETNPSGTLNFQTDDSNQAEESGGVLNVHGNNGLITSCVNGSNTITVNGVNATTSAVGVASFNSANFTVNGSGQVSLLGTDAIQTVTGDSGGAISPTAGNLNIVGTSAQGITSSGLGSTLTFTVATATTSQKGVTTIATNAEAIAGTDTAKIITADDMKAKLGAQTLNGLPYGGASTAAINWTSAPTDGQVLIGSSAGAPALATITAGTGISISNGHNSITINGAGAGMTWQAITLNQTLAINNGYIVTSGTLSLALPTTAAVGSMIGITLDGGTSFTITQAAGQQIRFGNVQTTSGATGTLVSNQAGDSVFLVCSVANNKWNVISSIGALTAN